MEKRKKVGLALGGGGARGFAHIGVLQSLIQHNIPIDIITGTSMGAIIGGIYASTKDTELAEKMVSWDWPRLLLDKPALGGFIQGKKIEDKMRELVGSKNIEDLLVDFGAVATDLNTGKPVLIRKGDLVKAMRSSGSFPGVFSPVKVEEHYLVDGGLTDPVPVEDCKKMGADVVIAVNLDAAYFLPKNKREEKISSLTVLKESLFLMRCSLSEKEVREADVVINPEVPYVMEYDFSKIAELISGGKSSTDKMIGKIREQLA